MTAPTSNFGWPVHTADLHDTNKTHDAEDMADNYSDSDASPFNDMTFDEAEADSEYAPSSSSNDGHSDDDDDDDIDTDEDASLVPDDEIDSRLWSSSKEKQQWAVKYERTNAAWQRKYGCRIDSEARPEVSAKLRRERWWRRVQQVFVVLTVAAYFGHWWAIWNDYDVARTVAPFRLLEWWQGSPAPTPVSPDLGTTDGDRVADVAELLLTDLAAASDEVQGPTDNRVDGQSNATHAEDAPDDSSNATHTAEVSEVVEANHELHPPESPPRDVDEEHSENVLQSDDAPMTPVESNETAAGESSLAEEDSDRPSKPDVVQVELSNGVMKTTMERDHDDVAGPHDLPTSSDNVPMIAASSQSVQGEWTFGNNHHKEPSDNANSTTTTEDTSGHKLTETCAAAWGPDICATPFISSDQDLTCPYESRGGSTAQETSLPPAMAVDVLPDENTAALQKSDDLVQVSDSPVSSPTLTSSDDQSLAGPTSTSSGRPPSLAHDDGGMVQVQLAVNQCTIHAKALVPHTHETDAAAAARAACDEAVQLAGDNGAWRERALIGRGDLKSLLRDFTGALDDYEAAMLVHASKEHHDVIALKRRSVQWMDWYVKGAMAALAADCRDVVARDGGDGNDILRAVATQWLEVVRPGADAADTFKEQLFKVLVDSRKLTMTSLTVIDDIDDDISLTSK
ncbi:hypothetical protein DYB34_005541 [Aphanomyces astaci]|uniref:Uncharacterized protein n=1 Tax=Aphanomyces astaci TaxID=112090 RepID=A0A3R6ZXU4_APHAT|nr:hypothetical protein DYB34_005541 [Aphanomyces astaci]